MKYIYKINGKVWKEVSDFEYRAPEKTATLWERVGFYELVGFMVGIHGGLGAYFLPEAWGGLAIGFLGIALASTLEDEDADVRFFWMILYASAAVISLVRTMLLMFSSLS